MKLTSHIGASTVISASLMILFRSWELTIYSFLSGIFIDLDHIVDYLLQDRPALDIKEFFAFFHEEKHHKIYIFLHSWELLILLFTGVIISGWDMAMLGILVGAFQHMLFDEILNRPSGWGYSLIWRWRCGFASKKIFPRDRR
jgi:hypothetical protein